MAFDEVLASRMEDVCPLARGKKMFGGYGLFLEDTMFAGVTGDRLMVKLGGDAEAAIGGDIEPFAPGGKPMRGWITVPQDLVAEDDELLGWLEKGMAGAGIS